MTGFVHDPPSAHVDKVGCLLQDTELLLELVAIRKRHLMSPGNTADHDYHQSVHPSTKATNRFSDMGYFYAFHMNKV